MSNVTTIGVICVNDDNYQVRFVKDKDFRRFNFSGILTNLSNNNNLCYLDFFEETLPLMTRFESRNGEFMSENEEGDLINYIHATASITPESIPLIIDSLNSLYERYLRIKSDG